MLRLIELFAGYGSQALALKYLNIPFEHWFVCEIDENVIKTYNDIHGTNFPAMDIRNVAGGELNIKDTDKNKYLLTYSFPCTSLSKAGNREGMERGSNTQSSLLWEVERIFKELKEKPQYLLMENVPQVIGQKNKRLFAEWSADLNKWGYTNYLALLNAEDYGIPQNRNRCFMVSILDSEHKYFQFPKKTGRKPLKAFLEDDNDEMKWLTKDQIARVIKFETEKGFAIKTANKKGYEMAFDGDSVDLSSRIGYHRGTVQKQKARTITTHCGDDIGVVVGNRIRTLTPLELFRLMGVRDEDYKKIKVANTHKFKMAGNSIVVNVLMAIFDNLLNKDFEQTTLF